MKKKDNSKTIEIESKQLISIFESINEPIYICDPTTYELLYVNKTLKDRFGDVKGKKCYKALQGLDSPCSFCTNDFIFGKNAKVEYIWEFQNRRDKRWYRCIDKAIKWTDGRMVRYEMAIDITDLKLLENSLKETKDKYMEIYENAPDGIYSLSSDGTIIEVNKTWLKMLGYKKGEVIGKINIEDLLTEGEREHFKYTFSKLKEKGSIANIEYTFKKKDGSYVPVIINSTALYDEKGNFIKSRDFLRDNTEKKLYENKLKHSAEEWRAMFDSIPYGFMLIDKNFTIMRANDYISNLTKIPIKKLIGRRCFNVIHGTDMPIEHCPGIQAIKKQTTNTFELYEKNLNKHLLLTVAPIFNEKGSVQSLIHSFSDITEIKEREKKIVNSRDAFLNMLKDLDFSYKELRDIYKGLIVAFVNALDAKSPWTKGHSIRVTKYSTEIAKELGLKDSDIEPLSTAALLHDIGKIGTYEVLLDKPGRLSKEEFELVKLHPVKGEEILKPIRQFKQILPVIRHHHERIDGKGYPDGLKGDEIPLFARIIHVADSFDSMTSDRPYRKAPGIEYAKSELIKYSGIQFDPKIVNAFIRYLEKTGEKEKYATS